MGAPVGNPNDGTQLGTAEVISDEYIDPALGNRLDPNQAPAAYKAPRSKIAVGPYGQDWGDASQATPLQVESAAERRYLEMESLRQRLITLMAFQKFSQETVPTCDSRGYDITTRGVR